MYIGYKYDKSGKRVFGFVPTIKKVLSTTIEPHKCCDANMRTFEVLCKDNNVWFFKVLVPSVQSCASE